MSSSFKIENVEIHNCVGNMISDKFLATAAKVALNVAERREIPVKKIIFFASGLEGVITHLFGVTDDGFGGFLYVTIQILGGESMRHVSVQFLEVKTESIERATFS